MRSNCGTPVIVAVPCALTNNTSITAMIKSENMENANNSNNQTILSFNGKLQKCLL